jgi:hypothetical protein
MLYLVEHTICFVFSRTTVTNCLPSESLTQPAQNEIMKTIFKELNTIYKLKTKFPNEANDMIHQLPHPPRARVSARQCFDDFKELIKSY